MGTRIFYRRGKRVEIDQLDGVVAQVVSGEQGDDPGGVSADLLADDTGSSRATSPHFAAPVGRS